VKLLQDICNARGFTSCIALTYNVDLGWFERFVLRQLRRQGVRQFLVFADRAQLSKTIETDLDLLHGLGRSYAALGIQATPSFHPKLLLLTGERAARLYVGSGNLTTGGYARNREIFERWHVTEADAAIPGAFEAARRFLDELCAKHLQRDPPSFVRNALDAAFGVRVLAKPRHEDPETVLWSSPGSLFARIEPPASTPTRLRLIAPYFDAEGGAAVSIAKRLGASTFEVITDLKTTNLTRGAYDAICTAGGQVRVTADNRPLHAKAVVAEGRDWALAVVGSANLSHAAWRGANVELVAVRRGSQAREVAALLDELPTKDFTPAMRAKLQELHAPPEPSAAGPAITDARWTGPATILVTVDAHGEPPTGGEIKTSGAVHPATLVGQPDAENRLLVSCWGGLRDAAAALRLVSARGFGPWAVIHNTAELAERAQPESRVQAQVRDLFGDETISLDAAEKLLETLVKMWEERRRQNAAALDVSEGSGDKNEEAEPRPDWCWVSPVDFVAQEVTEPEAAGARPGLSSVPLPANLLRWLLFGDAQEDEADVDEGESDADEERVALEVEAHDMRRASAAVRASFIKAAEKALKAYLGQLGSKGASRSAPRLLDDMHVLAAVAHYAFASNALSVLQLRGQLVRLLHAFLGLRSAPFPRALEAILAGDRAETWSGSPILLLGTVLAYNTCLADLDISRDERDLQQLLDSLAPALWVRNLMRAAPPGAVNAALESLDSDIPRLRRGPLWLGEAWPVLVARIPFDAFARKLIQDAQDIVCAERLVLPRLAEADDKLKEDDHVVGPGRDGALACGWIERDESSLPVYARLYDSAFLLAVPPPGAPDAPMHRFVQPRGKVILIETAYEWATEVDDGGAAQRGIIALERMLP